MTNQASKLQKHQLHEMADHSVAVITPDLAAGKAFVAELEKHLGQGVIVYRHDTKVAPRVIGNQITARLAQVGEDLASAMTDVIEMGYYYLTIACNTLSLPGFVNRAKFSLAQSDTMQPHNYYLLTLYDVLFANQEKLKASQKTLILGTMITTCHMTNMGLRTLLNEHRVPLESEELETDKLLKGLISNLRKIKKNRVIAEQKRVIPLKKGIHPAGRNSFDHDSESSMSLPSHRQNGLLGQTEDDCLVNSVLAELLAEDDWIELVKRQVQNNLMTMQERHSHLPQTEKVARLVQDIIWRIKAVCGSDVSTAGTPYDDLASKSKLAARLLALGYFLHKFGYKQVILACTELPIAWEILNALDPANLLDLQSIDPAVLLAQELRKVLGVPEISKQVV